MTFFSESDQEDSNWHYIYHLTISLSLLQSELSNTRYTERSIDTRRHFSYKS